MFLECETQKEKEVAAKAPTLHYHVSDHIKSAQEKGNTIVLDRCLEDERYRVHPKNQKKLGPHCERTKKRARPY